MSIEVNVVHFKQQSCRNDFIKMRKSVSTVLILCISTIGWGQPSNLRLENFNTEAGLSQNLVYSIAQDKQGFLWFGTDEGLNRFDGYEFKVFRHSPQDSTSIVDNSIHSLLVDHTGILWIGTNNGISKYNPITESFENLQVDFLDVTKPNGTGVNVIKEDKNGNIWIGYLGSGIDVFKPGEKIILHYTTHREANDPQRLPDDYITSLEFLEMGETVVGTRSGLVFIGADGNLMPTEVARKKFPWKDEIDPSVKCISVSSNKKNLWVGTESKGFYWVNLQSNSAKNFNTKNSSLLFNNNVPAVLEDSRGNVWIGGEAIYIFEKKNNDLLTYNERGVLNNAENKNPVLSIFEDAEHNVWFGTFRLGTLKYNLQAAQILHYHSDQGNGSIKNNQVLSFVQDNNSGIWVGTDGGGLFKLKRDMSGFEPAFGSNNFTSQVIKCMYKDGSGNFWIGTWDGGMMKYNSLTGAVEIFSLEKKNFASRHVWDFQGDSNGDLWIATLRDGLCHFNLKTKSYTYYKSDPGDSTSLVNNDVLTIFLDSENILWIGTADGLSVLYPGSKKFVNRQKKDSIANALCFYEDRLKRIWIGTNGGGIILIDKKLHILKMITEKDGLPSSTICAILPDEKNNLWVTTYRGLVKIDLKDFVIEEVPQAAGLQGKEFIARSALKTNDGRLLFGGVNGFNLFHPDSLIVNPTITKIVFTSLKIQSEEIKPGQVYKGRKILDESISVAEKIILSYQDNSFTLSFSPLVYNWQSNIRYSYQLENFDPDWQYISTQGRYLHYTSLDPGNYNLKIRTSFDGKHWKELKQLQIIVTPPWWETTVVKALAIALAGLLLYSIYLGRVKLLKRQKEKLETLVLKRTSDLKKSNNEIQLLLRESAEQKHQIEEQNHELKQTNDAVVQQRDVLELKSVELEKAHQKMQEINSNLELLVEKRTQKLSNTLRELETFLYRASHDLRGPISSMLGLLNAGALEDQGQLNTVYSGLFRKTVLKLDNTLTKLLLKHTLERKKVVSEIFSKAELEKFIKNILPEIPSFRIDDFEMKIEEHVRLSTDRLILKTILVSLLENAFFFSASSSNKKVMLVMKESTNGCILEVKDFGAGINPEQKEKIFQMFYRGHELSTGNGLGLYMLKSALEKINARVEVISEEGKFSIFVVHFSVVPIHSTTQFPFI
ncbi:MAG: hypothetical protein HYR67_17130 [Bacteroidetes bacterium]|nr:hypothetical protein [Bacteroidota bacterium]